MMWFWDRFILRDSGTETFTGFANLVELSLMRRAAGSSLSQDNGQAQRDRQRPVSNFAISSLATVRHHNSWVYSLVL
jgi:hypothetical protein